MQQARVEQLLHHDLHAADAVEIDHVVLAVRLHVGDVRDARADAVEVVELELDARLVGDREQVQHRVGRTAERHHDRDRVLERLLGHDLAGPEVELEQVHHRPARLVREVVAAAVDRRRRRAPGQRHADRLAHRRHRVRGEHARARTFGRARAPLDLTELVLGDRAGRARADGLEHAHDVERLVLVVAGQDRAAVEEHRRQVDPGRGHQHAGQALVAARERDERVEALGVHHALDRVGDDLARHERAAHALRGPSRCRRRPRSSRTRSGSRPRRARRPWPASASRSSGMLHGVTSFHDDATPTCGLAPVGVGHADRAQHRPGGRARVAVGDLVAPRAVACRPCRQGSEPLLCEDEPMERSGEDARCSRSAPSTNSSRSSRAARRCATSPSSTGSRTRSSAARSCAPSIPTTPSWRSPASCTTSPTSCIPTTTPITIAAAPRSSSRCSAPRVARLVGAHVVAKRYLVTTDPAYRGQLSRAQRRDARRCRATRSPTPSSPRSATIPISTRSSTLRRADERAKDPDGAASPALDAWRRRLLVRRSLAR